MHFRQILGGLSACFCYPLLFGGEVAALPLSIGDQIEVSIPEDTYFARAYEVNQAGNLEIPFVGEVPVAGLDPAAAAKKLSSTLISEGYFPEDSLRLSVQVVQWAAISVFVQGEVFQPGWEINSRSLEASAPPANPRILGKALPERTLTDAVRGAGGVLPTADIRHVQLVRGYQTQEFDLSGFFSGDPAPNPYLLAGDQIIIPQVNAIQPDLIRPSAITPPGIRVFISNLTQSANSNSGASVSNSSNGVSFPYGSRFSQGAISGNCAGGLDPTQSGRRVALFRHDQDTGVTQIVEHPVEYLLRESLDEKDNPYLMPGDGIVCYDSGITATRDVFRAAGEMITPLSLLRNLLFSR